MKITLDLAELVAKGQLTQAEADRLKGLASVETGALGVNILLAFGALAVSMGIGVLVPHPFTAIGLGGLMFGLGFSLTLAHEQRLGVFAQVCMVVGALGFIGGVAFFTDGNVFVNLILVALTAAAGVVAQSGLMVVIAVLALTGTIGTAFTGWNELGGATIVTIVVLMGLTLALYLFSLRTKPVYERLAITGARTAILMTNFAFFFGSIFGDMLTGVRAEIFAVVWAVLLIAFGIWGVVANRRWVVNLCAVFGAIHFFVQWFWHLGASPFSILGGGLLLIVFGFGLKWLNDRRTPTAPAAAA